MCRPMCRRHIVQPHCGAITFVQRFGAALQLNLHFHVLVPDGALDDAGVFVDDEAPDVEAGLRQGPKGAPVGRRPVR